jgi:hypothetical protein
MYEVGCTVYAGSYLTTYIKHHIFNTGALFILKGLYNDAPTLKDPHKQLWHVTQAPKQKFPEFLVNLLPEMVNG